MRGGVGVRNGKFHQRMFRRDHHICRAKQRVGPRGEHAQFFRRADRGIIAHMHREINLRALTAPNPFRLLGARALGPIDQLQIIQQPLRIFGDAKHPLLEWLSHHGESAALALAIDHFFVGKDGAKLGAPVHKLLAQIREAHVVNRLSLLARVALAPQLADVVGQFNTARAGLELLYQLRHWPRLLRRLVVPRVPTLQPNPLGKAHIFGVNGGKLTAPVV